ncbi:hypothetical protein [Kangiella sp.]|uniref:hypothetical protein n=1 Tax=Kangiella sp. TaxID=1920245 RepID=UPI00199A595E|nr:hypothetical protein [Kangiella sp.]MBD3652610.1 hypothetical protein [Kangiella sp.]
MKIVYTILLLSSLALNGFLLLGQSEVEPDESLKDDSLSNIGESSQTELADLKNEIVRLKNRLALAEKEAQSSGYESGHESNNSESTPIDSNEDLKSPQNEVYTYEGIDQKNLAKAKQYQAEGVNPGWAYDSEEHITDMITSSDLISEFSLQGVSCKTSMCKLTITPYKDTDQEAISILMGISILAFDSDTFKDYHTRSIPNENTGELDIYFYPAEEESD